MSVATYTEAELATIYRRFEAARQQRELEDAPTCEEFALALQAFLFANQTAFYLTYSQAWLRGGPHVPNLDPIIAAEPVITDRVYDWELRELVKEIRLLIYNTVTNNGTHCMAPHYEQRLEFAAQCIADDLAMIYAAA